MLAKVESRTVFGIEAKRVEVEVDITGGLPHFAIVGLADTAVKESRDRVISAIKNCGFSFPPKRITINLAPADLKREILTRLLERIERALDLSRVHLHFCQFLPQSQQVPLLGPKLTQDGSVR